MRLQGALDNDILVATRRFLADGVPAEVEQLYTAIQRSNSSLKRRPKPVIQASLERVLEFIAPKRDESEDSDAAIEKNLPREDTAAELMNRSLRQNLVPASPNVVSQSGYQTHLLAIILGPQRITAASG